VLLIKHNECISICKKEKLKDETSKKIVKPMEVNRFHKFSLDISSLIVTTSAFVKKERSKRRHLKKIVKSMEVKLRSKMSPVAPYGVRPVRPGSYLDFEK